MIVKLVEELLIQGIAATISPRFTPPSTMLLSYLGIWKKKVKLKMVSLQEQVVFSLGRNRSRNAEDEAEKSSIREISWSSKHFVTCWFCLPHNSMILLIFGPILICSGTYFFPSFCMCSAEMMFWLQYHMVQGEKTLIVIIILFVRPVPSLQPLLLQWLLHLIISGVMASYFYLIFFIVVSSLRPDS